MDISIDSLREEQKTLVTQLEEISANRNQILGALRCITALIERTGKENRNDSGN